MHPRTSSLDELCDIREQARLLEDHAADAMPDRRFRDAPIVLFGAGPLGEMTIGHMRRIGRLPVALADNNKERWGTLFQGIPIFSPGEVIRKYAKVARFLVTIYNGSCIRRELEAAGCACVSHFADFYFEHAGEFLPFCGLATRSAVLHAWPDVAAAADIWHDARSSQEYRAQLSWRLRLPNSDLPTHDPSTHCYFPAGLYQFAENEVLLDCGAFDGDSLQRYFSIRPPGTRPTIVAFEPDPGSFSRLAKYAETLKENREADIRIEPRAVAGHSGTIGFTALGSVTSGVAEGNTNTVPCVAIDDLDLAPTLVKMDVEGFELQALQGAAHSVQRHQPVLAVSLYHHAADLWTIPLYVKALVPDYRLFLRRYAEDCWEQILYAVPDSRLSTP
jgi:FkbM family methyltransferase